MVSETSSVTVKIHIKGQRHDVTGHSAYNNKSYASKYKSAILNAYYENKRNFNYNTVMNYEVIGNPIIAHAGKTRQQRGKKLNRKLDAQLIKSHKKKGEQFKAVNKDRKELDKSISNKKYKEELYGKTKTRKAQKVQRKQMKQTKPKHKMLKSKNVDYNNLSKKQLFNLLSKKQLIRLVREQDKRNKIIKKN